MRSGGISCRKNHIEEAELSIHDFCIFIYLTVVHRSVPRWDMDSCDWKCGRFSVNISRGSVRT